MFAPSNGGKQARKRDGGANAIDDGAILNRELVARLNIDRVGPVRNLHLVDCALAEIAGEDLPGDVVANQAHTPKTPFNEAARPRAPVLRNGEQLRGRNSEAAQSAHDAAHRTS